MPACRNPSWYQCGAQGDRRAGTAGPSLSEFNFESQWGQKALKAMYRAICEVQHLPLHRTEYLKYSGRDGGDPMLLNGTVHAISA